jgi:hypothetical protein
VEGNDHGLIEGIIPALPGEAEEDHKNPQYGRLVFQPSLIKWNITRLPELAVQHKTKECRIIV